MAKGILFNPVKVINKAMRHAEKNFAREVLTHVHLDGCGDVVTTDSFRMFVAHEAYAGDTIDLTATVAREIAKCRITGNDHADVEVEDGVLRVRMKDGTVFEDDAAVGKYPSYKSVIADDCKTIAYLWHGEIIAVAREHLKAKRQMAFDVAERDLAIGEHWFEKACDGEDVRIAFDAKFVRDALLSIDGNVVTVKMNGPTKPASFVGGEYEVVVMPVKVEEHVEDAAVEEAAVEEEDEMEKRIEELEKELASAKAAAKMWQAKAEEYYSAKPSVVEPPKPPKAPEVPVETVEVADEVTLEYMVKWCESHPNTTASQVDPERGDCIWVHGVMKKDKETQEELTALGFRACRSKKSSWWKKPVA